MQDTKFKKVLEITVVIIFFSAFVLSVSSSIRDPDVFWHLKTGEWMWQNRSLPDKDPFSFTIEPHQTEASAQTSFVLKQYWLAQLIIYGFYQIGGFYGIVAFRCLIYLGIGLVLYYWMGNKKNSSNSSKSSFKLSRMSRLIFLIPAVFASVEWLGERPNTLSFLFAVIVVYLLENLKKACSEQRVAGKEEGCSEQRVAWKEKQTTPYTLHPKRYTLLFAPYTLLPVVMLLWANMHGGFILGDAIIILYMIAEGIKSACSVQRVACKEKQTTPYTLLPTPYTLLFAPYTLHAKRYTLFFIVCLISILISFVNPNTYKAIYIISGLAGGEYSTISVTEHMSPFYYASRGIYKYLIFICVMIAPFLFSLCGSLIRVKQHGNGSSTTHGQQRSLVSCLINKFTQFCHSRLSGIILQKDAGQASMTDKKDSESRSIGRMTDNGRNDTAQNVNICYRQDINSTLLVVFLTVISLKSIRFIPFLIFIATPFIAKIWREFFDRIAAKAEGFFALHATRYTLHAARYTLSLLVVIAFAIFLVLSHMKDTVLKSDIISPLYPVKAVKFIKAERPEGEIFNEFAFGGYLVWSLYPDYKVFMDGRRLFQSMELAYVKAHSGSADEINGIPEWKAIIDAYRVRTVLVSGVNVVAGGFTRLVRRLVEDNEWRLVFIDKEALLFIKDTGKNREIIKKYSRPKVLAYGKALEQAEFYKIRYPKDWKAYATLGEINLYLGRPKVALLNFESAFKLNPSLKSTSLGKLIEEVKAGRDYSKLLDEIFR